MSIKDKLSDDDIESVIATEHFYTFAGTQVTVCCLILRNGYAVTAESVCGDPGQFDPAFGKELARKKAKNKIWSLEGYLQRERLSWHDEDVDGTPEC